VGGIIFIILLIITAVWAYLKHTAQSPFDVSPILGDNDDEEMIGQDEEEEEEQEITTVIKRVHEYYIQYIYIIFTCLSVSDRSVRYIIRNCSA